MMTFDREAFITTLRASYPGVGLEDAQRAADRMERASRPASSERAVAGLAGGEPQPPTPSEIAQLEKLHEHDGDKLMRALGFEVVRFSHPAKTKQTPGIADRRYYHRERRLALWWEVKAEWGQQRPDQKVFQEMVEACGEPYVLGPVGVLRTWLAGRRVCAFGVDNTPIPLPLSEQVP